MTAFTGRRTIASVAILALIYAVCYTAIKAGLAYAPPIQFAAWPWIAALAVTGVAVAYGAMFSSPGRTGAGLASVLGNTGPLLLVILAWAVLGERVTARSAWALVLGFAGVSLIAGPAFGAPGSSGVIAYALPLLAATGTASESVIYKRAGVGAALISVAAWQLVLGSFMLFGLAAAIEPAAPVTWSVEFVSLLGFLGVVGTAIALTLWYSLVERHEVGRLGLLLFLVPILGLGIAVTAFREPITPLQVVGVLLTIGGLAALAGGGGVSVEQQEGAIAGRQDGRTTELLDRTAAGPDEPVAAAE